MIKKCTLCAQWGPVALTLCHHITGKAFQLFLPLTSLSIYNQVNLFKFLGYGFHDDVYPPLKCPSVGPAKYTFPYLIHSSS